MISLAGLNDKQREAAETIDGPVLILAGAGSGKTRTLTYRIAHMVDNLHIPGKSILAVSFTNKAAKEMKERVITLLGKQKSRGMTLATFHSLGLKILKKEITHLGYHKNFSIYDQTDQLSIIREGLRLYHDNKGAFKKEIIASKIGKLKNEGIKPEDFADSPFFDGEDPYDHAVNFMYEFYQDKLKFYNAIDFDDILLLTVRLFDENPELAREYSEQFRYIMVDEYQDTNPLQFRLIRHLTCAHDNLCVVGDDDQAIYSFRGADISNIIGFERDYSRAKVVKLEQNYRSVSPILKLANSVIKENKDRRDKTLWSDKPSDMKPILWELADTDHEAEIVVEDIVSHQSKGGHLGDIAILYRSNTQAAPIEEQLRLSQVPYTIIGGQKFYEKKEVKDIMAYLQVIRNPADQMALRRVLNVPSRGIGIRTLEKFLEESEAHEIDLFSAMKKSPELAGSREEKIKNFVKLIESTKNYFDKYSLSEAITNLIEDLKYFEYIDKCYDQAKQASRRKDDIHFFIESAARFTENFKESATLSKFLEKLMLQDSQDSRDDDEEDDDVRKNEVTLMTLHSSKGLEFKQVYMIGVEEELLPHKRTIINNEGDAEERRLCYVGITRAQEKLIMTVCKERKIYGNMLPRHRSRFIVTDDAKRFYQEQDRQNFGHLESQEEVDKYKKDFFSGLMNLLD
ncbi:ATP-dependent helicase [Halobacteriovorax sp. BALOs_7]|uniref:ATP-dependent helicase n=1 Tax=Halobacteriovorax sp. BALOs_7 TaxID=2109558 RepID=UPI000EA115E4|nr:UvrD-helicase domain-containing protein [Halobacteriovorax sp. BALOs_7]